MTPIQGLSLLFYLTALLPLQYWHQYSWPPDGAVPGSPRPLPPKQILALAAREELHVSESRSASFPSRVCPPSSSVHRKVTLKSSHLNHLTFGVFFVPAFIEHSFTQVCRGRSKPAGTYTTVGKSEVKETRKSWILSSQWQRSLSYWALSFPYSFEKSTCLSKENYCMSVISNGSRRHMVKRQGICEKKAFPGFSTCYSRQTPNKQKGFKKKKRELNLTWTTSPVHQLHTGKWGDSSKTARP